MGTLSRCVIALFNALGPLCPGNVWPHTSQDRDHMTNWTIAGVPHQRAGLRGGQSLPGLHPLLAGGEGGEAGGQEETVYRLHARVLSIWVRKALSFNLNLHPSWLRSTSQPIIFAKSSPSRSFHFHSTSVVPPSPHTTLESCSIVLEKEGEFKYFQNSLFVSVALKWKWSLDT